MRDGVESLLGISVELGRLRDLRVVLDRVLTHGIELTSSQLGFIGLLKADRTDLEVVAISGFSPPDSGFFDQFRVIPARPSVLGVVILRRCPKLSNDVANDPDSAGFPPGHPPVTAFLGVPLRLGDDVIGMMGVGNKPSGYTAFDERLLTGVADQAAVAIDNARLYERQREMIESLQSLQGQLVQTERKRVLALEQARSAERLRQAQEAGAQALIAVSRHVDSTADLPSFFGRLSETIAGLVRARRVAFWRLCPDNTIVVQPETFGFSAASVENVRLQLDPSGRGIPERGVFHDEAHIGSLNDAQFDGYRGLIERMGVKNAVAVSWRSGDTILGRLAAYDSARGFTEEDAWILRIAARAAGLVWQYKQAEAGLRDSIVLLERTGDDRQRLLERLVSLTARERRRIANDIHDDVLQVLTGTQLRLQRLRTRMLAEPECALVEDVATLVHTAEEGLRRMLLDLRPSEVTLPGGLVSAVRSYLATLESETDIHCELVAALAGEVPHDSAQITFRVVQEALRNAAAYSRASSVIVALENQDGGLRARVRDDGRGFAVDEDRTSSGHIGLLSMRERVELAGGWFNVESGMGDGTTVEFWVPHRGPEDTE